LKKGKVAIYSLLLIILIHIPIQYLVPINYAVTDSNASSVQFYVQNVNNDTFVWSMCMFIMFLNCIFYYILKQNESYINYDDDDWIANMQCM